MLFGSAARGGGDEMVSTLKLILWSNLGVDSTNRFGFRGWITRPWTQ
jgi:hypothetical protein